MRFYGATDIGMQRKENQDRVYVPTRENDIKLFIYIWIFLHITVTMQNCNSIIYIIRRKRNGKD